MNRNGKSQSNGRKKLETSNQKQQRMAKDRSRGQNPHRIVEPKEEAEHSVVY